MGIDDLYLFSGQGFSAVGSGNHCGCPKPPDHNAGQTVLSCSQGKKHLASGCNGVWQSTWHSQSSTKVSAWSQQSQPVCMCWDHCAACFFWLQALGMCRKMRRRRRTKSRAQGDRTLGSGSGWLQLLSSGPSLSGWISLHWPLVWNQNNTSLTIRHCVETKNIRYKHTEGVCGKMWEWMCGCLWSH